MERDRTDKLVNAVFLASAATTAALHGYIEGFTDHGHGFARVPVWETLHKTDTQTTTQRIGDGEPRTLAVDETMITPGETASIVQLKIASSPYARLFDQDSAVSETDTNALHSLRGIIDELHANDWENLVMRVRGAASAEDDSPADDAGLTTPSHKNQLLADARRDAFLDAFEQTDTSDITIERLPGVEDSLSVEQLEGLEQHAEHFGYQSVRHMVQAWQDNAEAVPPVVASSLDVLLDNERGVFIEIFGQKSETADAATRTHTQLVCAIPVKETIREKYTAEHWKVTIPYAVPLLLSYIPLMATGAAIAGVRQHRRSNTSTYPDSGPYVPETAIPIAQQPQSVQRKTFVFPGSGLGDVTPSTPPIQGKRRPPRKRPTPPTVIRPPHATAETIVDPPFPPEKPEKHRRKWPAALAGSVCIGALFLLVKSCDIDTNGASSSRPERTPAEVDPCRDLPEHEYVAETKTIKIVDGVIRGR